MQGFLFGLLVGIIVGYIVAYRRSKRVGGGGLAQVDHYAFTPDVRGSGISVIPGTEHVLVRVHAKNGSVILDCEDAIMFGKQVQLAAQQSVLSSSPRLYGRDSEQ